MKRYFEIKEKGAKETVPYTSVSSARLVEDNLTMYDRYCSHWTIRENAEEEYKRYQQWLDCDTVTKNKETKMKTEMIESEIRKYMPELQARVEQLEELLSLNEEDVLKQERRFMDFLIENINLINNKRKSLLYAKKNRDELMQEKIEKENQLKSISLISKKQEQTNMKTGMIEVKRENESFLVGKYPVTQKEWKEVMDINPSHFKGDNLPVESISWYDAIEFCNKLSIKEGLIPVYTRIGDTVTPDWDANGYRLPIETEWEYAAKGGNESKGYLFSGSHNIDEVAWYGDNSSDTTHPVGNKKPNELGLYDMTGNVWEWCWNLYNSNLTPAGSAGCTTRVCRGGSWSNVAGYCTVSCRNYGYPTYTYYDIGFRLCRNK